MAAAPSESSAPPQISAPSSNKWLIAVAVMLATIMEVLDTTIANVALLHIRGSLSAGVDEAAWVLTSYIVANAIMIPLTGWCGAYFGRKRYLHLLDYAVRRQFAHGRCFAESADPDRLPHPAGHRRRRDDADVAGHPDGDLSARGAGGRDVGVGPRHDARSGDGADTRRLDHRQL